MRDVRAGHRRGAHPQTRDDRDLTGLRFSDSNARLTWRAARRPLAIAP
jgi:hypothetical protein